MTHTDADFVPLGDWTAPGPAAGCHILVHDRGRVLLQLRDGEPDDAASPWAYPGWWSLFGGGVEPGEPLAAAARRELAEETGLDAPAAALAPFARVVSGWGTRRTRLYVFTAALHVEPAAVRLGEGAGFAMVTRRQLDGLKLIPEFRPVFERFFAGG